ncbi:MAG: histidine--tRNA ligase [Trueperaceae bacterium]|nr:histidine--tRNA ligase [Trueperaceae bacterium]
MRLQAVKGTADRLPADQPRWRRLHEVARRVLERAGVQELTPPVFEFAEVFERSVGEAADLVVQKEMYTFDDRGGRRLTLRPEFTASVLRAYVEHGMHTWPSPVKLWSHGPAFRAENVQRGRFRQFHQVNLEVVGSAEPVADAEAIALFVDILRELGLTGVRVALGSVGDPDDRARYNAYLRDALAPRAGELTETSQERLRLNPMRLLDAKDPGDRALIAGLARPLDRLGDPARAHFDAVAGYLRAWEVPFDVDPAIVRGLDYYRRTAFEIHAEGIGAQSALGGGGRYDGLVAQLGGPDVPGIGWAFGVERVLDALAQADLAAPEAEGPALYLVPMDDEAVGEVAHLARRLRARQRVEHGYVKRAPGKGLRDADRAGARYAGLIGARERAEGTVQLKHLATGVQRSVPLADLADALERPESIAEPATQEV